MKTFLFYSKRLVWGIVMLGAITTTNAQQPGLKTKANKLNGRQIYHQSKIYDNSVKGNAKKSKVERIMEDIEARERYEFQRLKNPSSNQIPSGIRDAELKFSSKIATGNDSKNAIATAAKSSKARRFSYWENRGPFNVGGRTRALAIDRTNENIILAGGVSGGLWRSTDAGQTWRKVTNRRQSPSITCIVQDPRPGQERVWYYGTGERFGNSASEGGAFFRGTGVFKSVNGGRTWRLLESTDDGAVGSTSPFDIINSIVIDPTNGDVYLGTINGVQRSQDGGATFQEVLASGFLGTVEVAVTPTGQLYATIRSDAASNPGFFTSSDGNEWTNITPEFLPATIGRTVMEIDPSDESKVVFFAQNLGPEGPAFLLKYDANASTPEETWTDLSANLPTTIGGPVGNLNLQGGYNMVVEISPADSNLMFVGGTNLYRSTTGFTTPALQDSWVAGYSPINDVSTYPDQHPDQHALVFYPSNPNKVLTGSDGGVAVTEDITTSLLEFEPVDWISLNQGYLTTQPYHVSFDPEANSDDLLAGFQDNSTWYTNSTDPKATWVNQFGGDGSYSAIADGGRTRYVSSQRGRVHRLNFDEAGELISYARVQPAGASDFDFIAPFILDANNDNIMYMPAGNRIWRNNNLDEIPFIANDGSTSVFAGAPTTVNWVNLPQTDTPSGFITSLDVSTYPVANRLYYGSSEGGIFKMDNANIDGQEVIDISSGKGLPEGGYVNDINVDESNSDRVIVSYSNYGIISLFLTENGGETWTNISGNLEENPDGSGNGPSVRSSAFLGGSQGFLGSRLQKVYVATSTGLYYTNRLNGERTRWIKEPFAIGNAVTDEVRTRKDGFIAVAAHGNGLFSARFPIINELPESSLSVAYLLPDLLVAENSEDIEVDITDLFVQTNSNPIDIDFTNSNPELVTATLNGNTITLSIAPDSKGQATIGLVATSGEEQVAEGFTINVSELAIYQQNSGSVSSLPSQFFTDFGGLAQSADDFTIPEGASWTIDRIVAFGGANNAPALTSATIVIYEDNNGTPGAEVYSSGQIAPISEPNDVNLNLLLPEAIVVESGTYWLSVYANLAFNPAQTQWFWASQNGGIGLEPQFKDDLNLFGTGAVDWTPVSEAFGRDPLDQVFQVFGDVNDSGSGVPEEEAGLKEPLTTLEGKMSGLVFPNPSTNSFTFNFNNLKVPNKVDIKIFDIAGNMVYQESGLDSSSGTSYWDASAMTPGFYFAKITSDSFSANVKLVKR
ncbi:T9SS type A sorting domain-containing protein [Aquimarina sp. U1-2]|uniref:T9SS type A sorting domain-containing protein n=1 Tax=Aquimarina sp. U1-2 TaxID=2823141 RepID=UPI001AEC753B|nr:T9SS type A sorting domain-containing protein [Aquimarina sp. U1-2]MBP2833334.1 T9SS type A sorting domain-containing protein [Aquimarina sp. U1-2]